MCTGRWAIPDSGKSRDLPDRGDPKGFPLPDGYPRPVYELHTKSRLKQRFTPSPRLVNIRFPRASGPVMATIYPHPQPSGVFVPLGLRNKRGFSPCTPGHHNRGRRRRRRRFPKTSPETLHLYGATLMLRRTCGRNPGLRFLRGRWPVTPPAASSRLQVVLMDLPSSAATCRTATDF